MKYAKIILIGMFGVLLYGGTLTSMILPDRKSSDRENRALAQKPKLEADAVFAGTYQNEYETYLNDQFPLRDDCVDLSSNLEYLLGKKDINGVYIGKDGYLIENEGETGVEPEQVRENVQILSDFLNEMTDLYGMKHVHCLMVPSKAEAMPGKMPRYAKVPSHQDVLDDLSDHLQQPDVLLDLGDLLRAHQEEYIYYRTDHHWTTLGAYYAWQGWKKKCGQETSGLEGFDRKQVFDDFYGTTYNKAHVKVKADEVEIMERKKAAGQKGKKVQVTFDHDKTYDSLYFFQEAKKGFNRYNLFFSKNTFQIDIKTQARTGKTLLLVKDSFANCFVPFLTEDFDQIIMIDYRYGKTPIGQILDECPGVSDVMVLFQTGKFMAHTKLQKLADTSRESTLEEFNLEEFLK